MKVDNYTSYESGLFHFVRESIHEVDNYTSDESGLFHFVRKSLQKGIRAIGKYLMCKGFILFTQRLNLCNRGTLGKGTLRMYPSLSVPTHPFKVLGL